MRNPQSWFFRICALEGAIALAVLLRIPSEGNSLSPARLALIGILLSLIALFAIISFRNPQLLDRLARTGIIGTAAALALVIGLILFLLRYLDPEGFLLPSLYERLGPLLWYGLALSIQLTICLLYLKNGFHLDLLRKNNKAFTASSVFFGILLVILIFVSVTKLGITKDQAYWGEPGVPILGWQFALGIVIGLAVLNSQLVFTSSHNSQVLRVLFPLSIYIIAVTLWLSVPIGTLRNSFYAPITPPFTTPFPYSDAGFYDYLSQSLLIGTDYLGGIPPRPLYVTFLALLHLLFGQDYINIIAAQTFVFALFPVALYWLGTRLHSHAAGVTVAFFAIFRELTTLWISSNTRTASTSMFITDFATATAIAFTCLAVLRWFERRDVRSALIAGGSFGLLLLLRTQSLIILPVLFIVAFFVFQRKIREWIRAGIIFGLAMTLANVPWLLHNYTVTGTLAFDDPAQMAVIYSQYSFDENLDISQFDFKSESLGKRLLSFTLANPGFVSGFITNHFLNTEIGALLALPLIKPFNGLLESVNLYWITWDGGLEWYNLALVIVYLAVIAVGAGAAWVRFRWLGFVPLAFNIGYALANGISRFSAWRYNLPVDWIIYFYFGIGIVEILLWVSSLFGAQVGKIISSPTSDSREVFKPTHAVVILVFVFIGSLPWLAKGLVQPRYTSTTDELKQQIVSHGMETQSLNMFLSQPEAVILEGKTLYPRFFLRNDGIFSANPWPVYKPREFARMGFLVLNHSANSLILPSYKPLLIPHGFDAIVLGCQRDDYIEARWMYLPESDEIFQAESGLEPCGP